MIPLRVWNKVLATLSHRFLWQVFKLFKRLLKLEVHDLLALLLLQMIKTFWFSPFIDVDTTGANFLFIFVSLMNVHLQAF